ncbi:MAG: Unknown protein [uncultured Sulfurovum sp.]|uniref:Lipoprotein n=1 Tax=uncultured Sulfurovum sp. TaxID=269237 RepID=A0A6S6T6J5_9BACT|nr:MAG: Unknown protein [uncultured Sulfurovum sp.]
MKTLTKVSILFTSILILLLQGCGNSSSSSKNYNTTLGESVAIGTTDENPVTLPNTNMVKSISQEISAILKSNVTNYNKNEAIDFSKETNYCDISGLKESYNSEDVSKISSNQNYENCQEDENLQHGKINIDYSQLDTEGKYPMNLDLSIEEDYTYNSTNLKKDLIVNSSIIYNSKKEVQQIQLKINGLLNYNGTNYSLQNITQTIDY